MEKLVEEIARLFCICCGELDWDSGLCKRIDPPTNRLCDLIKKIVPDTIALILKAVVDGMPLPGEVARGIMESVMIGDKVVWRGANKRYRYIALRKEEDK